MINNPINWSLINNALSRYTYFYNYEYVEVPWLVSYEAISSTFTEETAVFHFGFEELYPIASAEQGFVQLLIDDKLETNKKYVALTPCFRLQENDQTHNPYFMKVELVCVLDDDKSLYDDKLNDLMSNAEKILNHLLCGRVDKVKTDHGYDFYFNGVEIGSYGIRSYKTYSWIYGTGLAEPRFSYALGLK